MSKRLTVMLLILLAAVLLLAHTSNSQVKLYATKVEFSGEVKLVWTRPINATNVTQFELYRAKLPDTTALLIKTTSDTSFVDHVPPIVSTVPQVFAYKVVAKTGLNIEHSNVVLVPVPGVPIVGAFKLEGKIDSGKIKLYWQKPPVENVSYYLVYGGHAAIAAPMLPRIDSTTNQWSITNAPIVINPSEPMPLAFYVIAKLTNGEMLTSTYLQLTINPRPNHDDLKFVSVPPVKGQINKKYEYTAKAVSSDPTAVIRYYGKATLGMLTVETGFKIDSVTGVVDWTPLMKGWYSIYLYAKSNKGGMAKQEFGVSVAGGNGIVQGKVTDTLNVGISKALIEIFKVENSTMFSFAYSTLTDENGNYRIGRIDPGSYKLRASVPGKYQSQWYDGVREVGQATVITVADSPSVTIANFKLRGGANTHPKVLVKGFVKDTAGFPIVGSNCRVVFVRAEFALNLGGGLNMFGENMRKYFELNVHGDFRLEGNSEHVYKTNTDSLGYYKIELPIGKYIAFARAKGYATEFYYESSDLLSADIFIVDPEWVVRNLTPPNFTLAPLPPVVLGEITGTVSDSVKDIFVPARLIAFRDRWRINDNQRVSRVYVTDTDSTGHYTFTDLLPGTYVVLAVPLGNYAPAFYSKDTSNTRWKRATKIVVNGNSVDNINIYVHPFGQFANGFTGITGTVNVNGGENNVKAGGIVYAYRDGEIAGYAVTNAEGNYAITGLAAGSYSVFVDKPGYNESVVVNADAGYSNSGSPLSGSANFTINSTTGVTVNIEVQPSNYILEQNYPNPFNPATTIRYSLPDAGNVSLKVYNLVGQEVATLINGYQTVGQYNVTFNGSNLSSGVYFYRLESGSYNVVKKMMLIK